MIVGIAEKMVNTFLENQVIDEENTEAYAFIPLMRDKMFYAALAICEIGVLLLIGYVKNKKLLVR